MTSNNDNILQLWNKIKSTSEELREKNGKEFDGLKFWKSFKDNLKAIDKKYII